MLLAHELWAHTGARSAADNEAWAIALAKVDRDTDREFRERWRLLGANQRRALRATVESGGAPYGSQSLAAVDLAKGGTAERAIDALIDLGELERTERGRYRVVDPLFVRWLLRQSERG
jgi:hypothetical protein